MVVVVQFLTANQDAPGHEVGAGVRTLEIAITPEMSDAIDHAGGKEGNPSHLNRPDGDTRHAKQQHVGDQIQAHAQCAVARVELALDPVVWTAMAVAIHDLLVLGGHAIKFSAPPEDFWQSAGLRAVRIFGRLTFGVVLAVNRGPLLGDHAGGQP